MVLDVTMVLFRPDWDALDLTFRGLSASARDFRTLRVLFSAAGPDAPNRLAAMAKASGITHALRCEFRGDNLGFAGGQNRLAAQAFASGADHVLILNPDCFLGPGALAALEVRVLGDHAAAALYGPTLELADRADRGTNYGPARQVDSLGIAWTSSGRHYDVGQGTPMTERPPRTEVLGVSGACLVVGAATWRRLVDGSGHLFNDMFVAYREDAELGVRARALGIPSVVLAVDGIVHARGTVGYRRGNSLVDALGARNRLLLRFVLGRHRPGAWAVATLRDVLVVLACLTVERASLPAVQSAFRVRRFMRYQRAALDRYGLGPGSDTRRVVT